MKKMQNLFQNLKFLKINQIYYNQFYLISASFSIFINFHSIILMIYFYLII